MIYPPDMLASLQKQPAQEQYLLDIFRLATQTPLLAYPHSNMGKQLTADNIAEPEVYLLEQYIVYLGDAYAT